MANGGRQKKRRENRPENREKERAGTRKRWADDPRVKARRHLQNLKRKGLTGDGVCVICRTDKNIEHHHPDYTKHDEYVDVCTERHRILHMVLRRKGAGGSLPGREKA